MKPGKKFWAEHGNDSPIPLAFTMGPLTNRPPWKHGQLIFFGTAIALIVIAILSGTCFRSM